MIGYAALASAFINPLLLGGMGLAVVPIIIHLLSRRRYRRIEWAATRFLLEAEKENRRRVRFEQWLLLALRCLAMALLALLVARPFVQPGLVAALLGGGGQTQRVVVLDDSASLAHRAGSQSEFDLLRAATGRLLSWLQQEAAGDPVTLYLTSQPEQPLISSVRLEPGMLKELGTRMEKLGPVPVPAHPRVLLAKVADSHLAEGAVGRTDIYVLSDFQRTDWLGGEGRRSAFEPIAQRVQGAGGGGKADARVLAIASGVQPRDNVGVVDLDFDRPQVVAGIPAVVGATVANFSTRPAQDFVARVELDGAPLPAVPVAAIDAGGRRRVTFEVNFPDAGYRELTFGIGPLDVFTPDDSQRISTKVKETLGVLIVNGQPAADPVQDEVHLLRNALSPPGPFSSGIRAEVIEPNEIESTDLSAFDCVILCNTPTPDEGAVDALQRFVRAGGGLVWFLGAEIDDVQKCNRLLYADGAGLLPLPLDRLVTVDDRAPGVGLVRTADHPVTAMFPAGGESLSEYVHFRSYFRCTEPVAAQPSGGSAAGGDAPQTVAAPAEKPAAAERPAASVLARYTDREASPAIVTQGFGRGRVLLFTSSADLEWNDWARAADGSYVVTMLEAVQFAAARDLQPRAVVAGQRLEVVISPDRYDPGGVFKSPAYPEEPAVDAVASEESGGKVDLIELRGPVAMRLGVYHVELTPRSGPLELRPICVNLDPAESDLAAATPAELDAALVGVPHQIVAAAENFLAGEEQTKRELWPFVLFTLVLVLFGEQSLAWYFGRVDLRPRKVG